jgi:hypothetical protein
VYQSLLFFSLLAPGHGPELCHKPAVCCTAEATVVAVPHTVYASIETEYCLPCRSLLKTLLCHGDEAFECGKGRVKHQLVKKIVVDEKCVLKCVPTPPVVCEPVVTVFPSAPPLPVVSVIPTTVPVPTKR